LTLTPKPNSNQPRHRDCKIHGVGNFVIFRLKSPFISDLYARRVDLSASAELLVALVTVMYLRRATF